MSNCIRLNLYLALGKNEDGEVSMLDSFFEYKDGMKGCTGSKFYFVSPQGIEQRNDLDDIKSNFDHIWKEEVQSGKTEEGLDDWAESFKDSYLTNSDGLFICHDTSYVHNLDRDADFMTFASNYTGQKLTGLYDSDTGTFECVGGGRCFDSKDLDLESYVSNERALLHDLARMFEGELIDLETVENILITNNIPFKREER